MTPQRAVLKYAFLPGYIPRIVALFSGGFSYIAYLMALVYQSVRLLPPNHPYLNPANMGKFGVRHVIGEAANNLVFSRKTIDQTVIFFTILSAVVLLVAQFALLIVAVVAQQPAMALVPFEDVLFVTSSYNPGPAQDLAFITLDRVFGTEGIFNSCVADAGVDCLDMHGNVIATPDDYPSAFHIALHTLLRFYSLGIFIVSVFIIIYFVIAIAAETAESGTPFGQRTNKAWAPIRLIIFFALLVPLNIGGDRNEGFNAAQIITFWTAKTGSNFATNAWGRFNENITNTYLGDADSLIATPNFPEFRGLIQFMFVAKTCKIAEEMAYDYKRSGTNGLDGIQAYVVRPELVDPIVPGNNYLDFLTTDFDAALQHANKGNITIRFGLRDENEDKNKQEWGNVYPYCGEIKLSVVDLDKASNPISGSKAIQQLYYEMLQRMWKDTTANQYAECLVRMTYQKSQNPSCDYWPDSYFMESMIDIYKSYLNTNIPPLIEQQVTNGDWVVPPELKEKGWAGAAIWYNRIAQMNGEVTTAIFNIPSVSKYPTVLDTIASEHAAMSENVSGASAFNPQMPDGKKINWKMPNDEQIAPAMYTAFRIWEDDEYYTSQFSVSTGNPFIDTINWVFGTSGIFNIRANTDIHPLAQLSSLGKGLMEASVRNLAMGYLGAGASKLFSGVDVLQTAGAFFQEVAMATIALGFVMFYILPFMPFIYFIFAVSGWIKAIFEAIVAMPLWALAHLRIDGEGLPGPAGGNGYFLLFEIFLRPILTVTGLLASIIIFSSLVEVLNDIFDIVVANTGGFDAEREVSGAVASQVEFMRSPVDEFFLTAMYVIITYTIGTSSFKLIDFIPNYILRWAGSSVKPFGEGLGDPAGQVVGQVFSGTQMMTGQLHGGALAFLK